MVCVECLVAVDGSLRCPDCNFPICCHDCIKINGSDDELEHPLKWHRNYECRLLTKIGFRAADGETGKTSSSPVSEVPQLQVQVAAILLPL